MERGGVRFHPYGKHAKQSSATSYATANQNPPLNPTKAQQTQQQRVPVQPIPPVHAAKVVPNFLEAKLKAVLASPIQPIDEEYWSDMKLVTSSWVDNMTDWPDFAPGKRPVYDLRKLDDRDIVTMGWKVFSSLRSNITPQSMCKLMLLAYNLKDSSGLQCFEAVPENLIGYIDDFEDISNKPLMTITAPNQMNVLVNASDKDYYQKVARGFCFLAASFMRVYAGSENNYRQMDELLIRVGFTDFFRFPFPLGNFELPVDAIRCIISQFEENGKLRNTFYNFLHAGESSPNGKDMKEFLYRLNTAMTGLKAVTLFNSCMESYNISNRQLAAVLTKKFESELEALKMVYNNFYGTQVLTYLHYYEDPKTWVQNFSYISSKKLTKEMEEQAQVVATRTWKMINELFQKQ